MPDLTLIAGSSERRGTTPIMTSWGCPFGCNFCSVTAMFGRKYRYRSPEHIMAEIEAKQPRSIFFYDDNFAADKRRLKTLLRMMIASGRRIPWSAQVRTDVASDPELLELMRDSGCDRVALGLESVSQETLDGFDKSQSVADIVRALEVLRRYGIKTHGMFVLGADSDTAETVRDTARFARKHDISTLMLNILTPLPGTPLFDELDAQGRIFDRHWDLFDGQHVVFSPGQMSPETLQAEVWRAYARFYSFRQWLKYLATFRYGTMALYSWYWVFLRRWRKERGNRDYLEMLKRLQLTPAVAGAARLPRSAESEQVEQVAGAPGDVVRPGAEQTLLPVPAPRHAHRGRARLTRLVHVADGVAHVPGRERLAVLAAHGPDLEDLARLLVAADDPRDTAHAVRVQDVLDGAGAAGGDHDHLVRAGRGDR